MSLLDSLLRFSNAQVMTHSVGSVQSTVVPRIGLGVDAWQVSDTPDIGNSGNLYFNVKVGTALAAASGQVVFDIDLYTHTAATSIHSGRLLYNKQFTLAAGTIAAGTTLVKVPIPAEQVLEYIGVRYTTATTKFTGGTVTAWLGLTPDTEAVLIAS